MNDQNDSTGQPNKSEGRAATSIAKPFNASPANKTTDDELKEIEKELSGFEKSSLRWAKVAVLLSGLAVLFVCAQWHEMHTSGIDTHDLAIAAGKQADAAKAQSAQAQAQTVKMSESITETKKLIGATSDLAKQSKRSADIANSAIIMARQNFVRDQRPYVWIRPQAPKFEEGKPAVWDVNFINSGRTPALNVETCVTLWWKGEPIKEVEVTDEMIEERCNRLGSTPHAPIFPGENQFVTVKTLDSFSGDNLKAAQERDEMFLVTGRVKYEDTFSNQYSSIFCVFRLANGSIQPCIKRNIIK